MEINTLLEFYKLCASTGYVRLISSDSGFGAVSIYAPIKFKEGCPTKVFVFNQDTDIDFFKQIKYTCWISYKLSVNNYLNMNKLVSYMTNRYTGPRQINYELVFKKNKVKIYSYVDGKKVKKLKLKLFTVNNNAKTE